MYNISQFFDAARFFGPKKLVVSGIQEDISFETKQPTGLWKLSVVILEDKCVYRPNKKGEILSNLGEKFTVRVPHRPNVNVNDAIVLVNPICSIYGKFNNELSVRADDVTVVVQGKA